MSKFYIFCHFFHPWCFLKAQKFKWNDFVFLHNDNQNYIFYQCVNIKQSLINKENNFEFKKNLTEKSLCAHPAKQGLPRTSLWPRFIVPMTIQTQNRRKWFWVRVVRFSSVSFSPESGSPSSLFSSQTTSGQLTRLLQPHWNLVTLYKRPRIKDK